MLRVVVENLAANAIRYAGPGATCSISVTSERARRARRRRRRGGVSASDLAAPLRALLPRRHGARSSRGTGLGLAIVKHIVTSAGGYVEATGREGLEIRITFPR